MGKRGRDDTNAYCDADSNQYTGADCDAKANCSAETTATPVPVKTPAPTVAPVSLTLQVGQSYKPTGKIKKVRTSNKRIAAVSKRGKIVGKKSRKDHRYGYIYQWKPHGFLCKSPEGHCKNYRRIFE